MRLAQERQKLFHKSYQTKSLGCQNCPESDLCGGNQTAPGLYDCTSRCYCTDPSECTNVCPRHPHYLARLQDIKGFELDNIPRCSTVEYSRLPLVVPVVYHKSSRIETLKTGAVAIPLKALLKGLSGELKFKNKKELAARFGFDETAKLIIVGSDDDDYIENYWSYRKISKLPEGLLRLQPDLITSPNYSVPLNVVRQDNLYNIKRIGIVWRELASQGIPTALHVNARTDHDWERWQEFVCERNEVQSLSFEFATGALVQERAAGYVENLIKIAKSAKRKLQLVIKGGQPYVGHFSDVFADVVFLDSNSFMRTVKRRQINWQPGDKPTYIKRKTRRDEALDDLFARNVETTAKMIEFNVKSYLEMKSLILIEGLCS